MAAFSRSTLENWQSEFLQLFSFVVMSALLIHHGSAESKDSGERMERRLERIEGRLKELQGAVTGGGWKEPPGSPNLPAGRERHPAGNLKGGIQPLDPGGSRR